MIHTLGASSQPCGAFKCSGQLLERCCALRLKESGFRSIYLSLALALSLGRYLRRVVARVRGVLEHLPQRAALWLAVGAAAAPPSRA